VARRLESVSGAGHPGFEGRSRKKVSSPAQYREVVQQVIDQHDHSERRACALLEEGPTSGINEPAWRFERVLDLGSTER
jgi:hypothetical protein